MKIQKISLYTMQKNPKFGIYDDSYDYDFGTANNQLTVKDAITTSALISGILLIGTIILEKGLEIFSKNKKSLHINKLV